MHAPDREISRYQQMLNHLTSAQRSVNSYLDVLDFLREDMQKASNFIGSHREALIKTITTNDGQVDQEEEQATIENAIREYIQPRLRESAGSNGSV